MKKIGLLLLTAALVLACSAALALAGGASQANAVQISVNTAYRDSLSYEDDVNYYKFTLPSSGYISVTFQHDYVYASGDIWDVRIMDEYRREYLGESYAGSGTDEPESGRCGLLAGTYYLQVKKDDAWSATNYTFKVNYTASAVWETELNNTIQAVNHISTGTWFYGSLAKDGDEDYFGFSIPSDGYVTVSFNHDDVDSSAELWELGIVDDAGNEYTNLRYKGSVTDVITSGRCGIRAGQYCIKIKQAGDWSNADYSFRVNYTASDEWENELNDTATSAAAIETGKYYSGNLRKYDDADYFRFSIPSDGYVSFSFRHDTVNSAYNCWSAGITDYAGNEYFTGAYAGNVSDEITSDQIRLNKGTYYIKVGPSNNWTKADYQVKAEFSTEPEVRIIASGTCGDRLTWTLDSTGLLTISGTGAMTTAPWSDQTVSAATSTILIGKGVTSLYAGEAIAEMDSCPATVKNFVVESGNTVYASRDGVLFNNDYTILIHYPPAREEAYTVPAGVKRIGNAAFIKGRLAGVTIPKGVSSIGSFAFAQCGSLKEITIPEGVNGIALDTFEYCGNLTSVRIPEGVTYIDRCAFLECGNLKEVFLPDSLDTISESAFAYCRTLSDITIPSGTETIGSYAFYQTPLLTKIVIPAGVTTVGDNAFELEGKLKEDLVVYCFKGTEGEKYADDYKHGKVLLDDTVVPPAILSQPQDVSYTYGETAVHSLTVAAETDEYHTLSWQWYSNTAPAATGGTAISGATEPTYIIPSRLAAGTYYYYCTVTSAVKNTGMTASADSRVATVTVLEADPRTPDEKISAFVSRCYRLILNREPDAGGLQGWCATLKNKTAAAANIIDNFVRSAEYINRNLGNAESVDILYQTMLNRNADIAGKAGWVDALNKGYSLQNIIDGFCGSDEFTALCAQYGIEPGKIGAAEPASPDTPRGKIEAFVRRCYELILSRKADQDGLKGWSDALESRTATAAQIIDGFVRSPEYVYRNLGSAESVEILYRTMLDRQADAGGKAGWVAALGQGYTLQHIINGFCGSAEFTGICNRFGIVPGTVGVGGEMVVREGITPEGDEEAAPVVYVNYTSEYTNEEKVRAFVEHCYESVFGREGDAEGIEGYVKLILDGKKTPKRVAYEFIFSDEFQSKLPGNEAFIRILYRLYLNREPGAEEAAGWTAMLENGASLEDIVNGFAGGDEFRAIVNGMKE